MESGYALKQARQELAKELHREQVEKYKEKLRRRANRSFLQRLFPWRIRIERIDT